jgi:Zn-dependent protease with chaperone function
MRYVPREPSGNVNVTPASPLKEFAVLGGALVVILLGCYLLLGAAVDWAVPRISAGLEKKLALALAPAAASDTQFSEQERLLQEMIDGLQSRCGRIPYRLQVHVRKSDAMNALALPGGHLVVFSGLLNEVASQNELVFILGHEMGHYLNRDHLRGLGRGMVLMVVSAVIFGADSSLPQLLGEALNVAELSFSRSQETAADDYGLDVLNCTFGHAGGATDFFRKIPQERDPDRFGHYISSHPEIQRRIAHLEERARRLGMAELPRAPLPPALSLK